MADQVPQYIAAKASAGFPAMGAPSSSAAAAAAATPSATTEVPGNAAALPVFPLVGGGGVGPQGQAGFYAFIPTATTATGAPMIPVQMIPQFYAPPPPPPLGVAAASAHGGIAGQVQAPQHGDPRVGIMPVASPPSTIPVPAPTPAPQAVSTSIAPMSKATPWPPTIHVFRESLGSKHLYIWLNRDDKQTAADYSVVQMKNKEVGGCDVVFYYGQNRALTDELNVLAKVRYHTSSGIEIEYRHQRDGNATSRSELLAREGSLSTRYRLVAVGHDSEVWYWKDAALSKMKLVRGTTSDVVARYHDRRIELSSKLACIEILSPDLSWAGVEQIMVTALALAVKPEFDTSEAGLQRATLATTILLGL